MRESDRIMTPWLWAGVVLTVVLFMASAVLGAVGAALDEDEPIRVVLVESATARPREPVPVTSWGARPRVPVPR
jgi:hypothetical protein